MKRRKPIDYIVTDKGCFNCTSHYLDKDGYPKMMVNKKFYRVHRFVYEQCFGEIPESQLVRHKCDNPSCINPEHLETGTYKENSDDKYKRNRQKHYVGEDNPNAKLSESDVDEIKSMLKAGVVITHLAKRFGVARATIRKIRDGKTWVKVKEIKG